VTLDDFLPFVLPKVKNCPEGTATFEIRNAIIDLCRRGLIWRRHQDPVMTVADQTEYDYAPEVGQEVVKLLTATLNGLDIPVITPDGANALTSRGESSPYINGGLLGFDLHPAQAAGLPIVTYCAVCPTLTATTVPDDFSRFAEAIGWGAVARLQQTAGQDFYLPVSGKDYESRFDAAVAKASTAAAKGFSRAQPRAVASWF